MPRPPNVEDTDWARQRRKNYYREHGEHSKRDKLTPAELERCLRAPTLIREIRGPDRIACLLCGRLFKRLSLHLPEHAKDLSTQIEELSGKAIYSACSRTKLIGFAFKRKFQLPKGFPICSRNFSASYAVLRRAGKPLPEKTTKELHSMYQKSAAARREWGRSPLQRETSRENLKGRDAETPRGWKPPKVSDWQVAELRLKGYSHAAIAKEFGCTSDAAGHHLRKMGFPSCATARRHGEWITGRHLQTFVEDWAAVNLPAPASSSFEIDSINRRRQMSLTEAAKKLGVPPWRIRSYATTCCDGIHRPKMQVGFRRRGRIYLGGAGFLYLCKELERLQNKKGLQAVRSEIAKALNVPSYRLYHRTPRGAAMLLSNGFSRKVAAYWEELKRKLRSRSSGASGGRPKKLLPSEEAALPARYQALRQDLGPLSEWLKGQRKLSSDRMMNYVCREARRGRLRTLLLWPEFFAWARKQSEWNFIEGKWRPQDVAIAFLASEFLRKYPHSGTLPAQVLKHNL
jgi:predicted transcriptional regulator